MATSTATGKKRMTQSDVINYFAERTGMKRAQVKQLFEDLANLATSEVKGNGEFVLPGFGNSFAQSGKRAKAATRHWRNNPDPRENNAEIPRWKSNEGFCASQKISRRPASQTASRRGLERR